MAGNTAPKKFEKKGNNKSQSEFPETMRLGRVKLRRKSIRWVLGVGAVGRKRTTKIPGGKPANRIRRTK